MMQVVPVAAPEQGLYGRVSVCPAKSNINVERGHKLNCLEENHFKTL